MRLLLQRLRTRAKKSEQSRCQGKVSLNLEMMEQRDVPSADLVWTAGGDGVNWSDANNWTEFDNGQLTSTHRTPTSSDTLFFGSLGGANVSSVDDIDDLTVAAISQNNTYTGDLEIDLSLTVTGSVTTYGATALDSAGSLDAEGDIYMMQGSLTVNSSSDTAITTDLLDMVDGASLTVTTSTTLAITTLTMGTGTSLDISATTTLDGDIGTAGTVTLSSMVTFTITGNYSQSAGELYLPDLGFLIVEGSEPVELDGHTVIGVGDSGDISINAAKVEIGSGGVLEVSNGSTLSIKGDLDLPSGTIEFDGVQAGISVSGNFSDFIGTLDMVVDGSGVASAISVGGTTEINQDGTEGGTNPILNLTQTGTITSPQTFSLIFTSVGTGDFNTITAQNTVLAQGFVTVGSQDIYAVTL